MAARNPAFEDLSERIALHVLTGWRLLWRSEGPVWDAYMAGVTDGVTYRIIGSLGRILWSAPCDTGAGPVYGPERPIPTHYPHEDIPGRPPADTWALDDGDLPIPPQPPTSCHYAPWPEVFALARTLDSDI